MIFSKKYYRLIIFLLLNISFISNINRTNAQSSKETIIQPLERFINIGENEGLTGKMIYCIIQDKDGFIWISTNAGVFRYDGKTFKRFTIDEGVTDNEVFTIYQDNKGRIWFLTFNGRLSYWKDGKIYNPGNKPFLKNAFLDESIYSSFEDSQGKIWFGSRRNGFIVIKDETLEIVKLDSSINGLISVYVHEDLAGNIWSFKDDKMFLLHPGNMKDSITLKDAVLFRCVRHGQNHETYFYTSNGVFKIYDHSSSLLIAKSDMPPVDKILNIFSSGEYLWLCTVGKGCYEYKNGKLIKNYFKNETITSAFRDRENNLWLGTMGSGIKMLPSSSESVTNFNQSSGLSSDMITSIAYNKKGLLWLGYGNGIVDEINNFKKRTFNLGESNDLNFFKVSSIVTDSTITWLGTDLGVYYIEKNNLNFVLFRKFEYPPARYSVKRIMLDSDGGLYATNTFNLLKVAKLKNGYTIELKLDSLKRTFSLVEINKGEFIVSGISGLIKYIPGKMFSEYKTDAELANKRFIDMKIDNDHNLLLASDGFGLYILNDGKLMQHFTLAEGLSDNICNRISISGDLVYVATNNGLDILKKDNGKYFISENITTNKGLMSNMVNDVALNDQLIYIATDKGLSILNQNQTPSKKFIGKINITEIITDTILDLSKETFNFKSDIPRLLIKFSYPVFNPDNHLNIKYRLYQNQTKGLDWITSTNNEIEFSSLSPGNYSLELKPASVDDQTSITKFNFTIVPLWWQTIFAKVILSLVIMYAVIYIIRRRVKQKFDLQLVELKQQAMLDVERNRIASDMHDDIGADLTKISMWANILEVSKTDTKEMVKKIIRSSEEVLQKMDQIIWALDSVHNYSADLISYLRAFSSRYIENTGIKIEFEIEGTIPNFKITSIQRRNIFLVVKELLHNSVKHSRAKIIRIKIFYENPTLKINYMDDGCGFDKSNKQDGMGFNTMKQRMSEINSVFEIQSENGKGVSVKIAVDFKNRIV